MSGRLLPIALVLVAACAQRPGVECDDGRLCPSGTICAEPDLCLLPDQLTACDGEPDQAPCDLAGQPVGICRDDICVREGCGDGFKRGSEACDRDDLGVVTGCASLGYYQDGPVACTDDCTIDRAGCDGVCGDGAIDDSFEQCDGSDLGGLVDCVEVGFYDSSPLRCNGLCLFDRTACSGYCGDGVHNGPELCEDVWASTEGCLDFGFDAGSVECSAACAPTFASCGRIGWRPVTPTVFAPSFRLWTSPGGDIWTIGEAGLVRFDGQISTVSSNGAFNNLWGTSDTDIWAVGGDVAHFDGVGWVDVTVPTGAELHAVDGTTSDDVWAVGAAGTTLHHDGSSWTQVTTPTSQVLWAVSSSATDEVWAVGGGGVVLRHDGSSWTLVPSGTSATLQAVWSTGDGGAWVVGTGGLVLRCTASACTPDAAGLTTSSLQAIWASGPHDIWVVGSGGLMLHFDGIRWTMVRPLGTFATIGGIWGRRADDIWVATETGTLFHYQGSTWVRWSTTPPPYILFATWGDSIDELWTVGENGLIARTNGRTWTEVSPSPTANNLYAMWGSNRDDIWAVGKFSTILHYDGASWSPAISPGGGDLEGVWGSGPRDVWAVGAGTILHNDGTGWVVSTTVPTGPLLGLWGSGPDDVWAVGAGGAAVHFDGNAWTVVATPVGSWLTAVWGSGPDDVWAVGGPSVLHWDGVAWTESVVPPVSSYEAVWGTGPDDVWAAGFPGTLIHYDGVAWAEVRSNASTLTSVFGLWGTGGDVVAVGWDDQARTGYADRLLRTVPWRCATLERSCGDAVDDDCDDLLDHRDPDCANAIRLGEVFGGTPGYVEVVNRGDQVANLDGMTVTWQSSCEGAPVRKRFRSDAMVAPGETFRFVDAPDDVRVRERHLGRAICDATDGGGWVALCSGTCDLVTCDNVIDYVARQGTSGPLAPPPCATMTPAPVAVGGSAAGDSITRTGFAGSGAAGVAADWVIAPASRD